jgi:hypothetical protein
MWSESIFTPLRAITSMTSEKCLPSMKQWSIWLKECPSWECQVWRWIGLCMKYVLLIALLPACGKVDQSEAIFICTLMQAVLAYRWLMYGFPGNFCVHVSHHQPHVMTWAGCVCPLQLLIKLILGLLF